MIVKNIQFNIKNRRATLSADIVIKNKVNNLYFSVDEKYSDFIFPDASPFTAAVLLSSMRTSDPISSESTISTRLHNSLPAIYKIFQDWKTEYRPTSIHIESGPDSSPNHSHVACFFSGGVDSFYTYLKNKNNADGNIKYLIFVHGFDIDLDDKDLFKTTHENLATIAKGEGVELIVVETNLREITDKYTLWGWSHGSALAAIALFLRNGFKKIYIPSSNSWDEIFPWGSHPDLDPLWSTEILKIDHDGNEANRLQKVKYISDNEMVRKYLRVCYNNYAGAYNCGKCEKCLRTMMEFMVWDSLEKIRTFNKPVDLKLVEKLESNGTTQRHFGECLKELKKQGRHKDIQRVIGNMLSGKSRLNIKTWLVRNISKVDRKYSDGLIFPKIYRIKKRLSRNASIGHIVSRII